MSVVCRDDGTGLLTEVALDEDGYTNERALIGDILAWIGPDDLVVADRNFCWAEFLGGLADRGACFNIRHHQQSTPLALAGLRYVGATATGHVSEQEVEIGPERHRRKMRCVIIRLFEPTEDGEVEVRLLSNVPAEKADALVLADLYLRRWRIENSFQEMTEQLRCEVNTLGYPKAALLGFSLAICAYNLLAVLKGALASVHGQEAVEQKLSTYMVAQEISQDISGLDKALPQSFWERFARMGSAARISSGVETGLPAIPQSATSSTASRRTSCSGQPPRDHPSHTPVRLPASRTPRSQPSSLRGSAKTP